MNRRQRCGNGFLAIVVFVGAGLLVRGALADSEEVARKHAAKANQLAAKNKCRGAIFEFTRARQTLKDPTLLFNRAECFRKVGRDDEAMTDYEEFLAQLPQAPNRPAVEARIAALRAAKAGAAAAPKDRAPSVRVPAPPPLLKPGDALPPPAAAMPPSAKPTGQSVVTAPAAKAAEKPAVAPSAAPAARAVPAVAPAVVTPPAKAAEKTAAPPAAAAKSGDKVPASAPAPEAKPGDKASSPVLRAKKWDD